MLQLFRTAVGVMGAARVDAPGTAAAIPSLGNGTEHAVWTERDQIQAYQFLRRRLVSALAKADANHPTSPSRRLVLGTVLGAAAALLTTAGFGVAGLLKPSASPNWRQAGQVIVEQGSGAHFVLGSDGLLHPVLNEASALLLAGADRTVTASANSLRGAPRGATLGIPGAPDALPTAGDMLAPALVTCSSVSADQPASAVPTSTVLLAADAASAGAGLHVLPAGGALLVQPPSGDEYLVTGGVRYRMRGASAVIALGMRGQDALRVSADWLDTVPAGRDLSVQAVAGAGLPGPAVDGLATRVGQILESAGPIGAGAYYLVRSDGLEPITQTQMALVLADTANAAAYPGGTPAVRQVSVAAIAAAQVRTAGADAAGYPERVPALVGLPSAGTVVVCAAGDGQNAAQLAIGTALPLPDGARVMPTGAGGAGPVADQVYVPPSSGALVAAAVAPGAPTGAIYLITDTGMKYPVVGAAAVKALGYGQLSPVTVSQNLLALLPTGPALSQLAAQAVSRAGVSE
jgi:type VII secretion protein EccB